MTRRVSRLLSLLVPAVLLLPGAAHAEKVVTEDAAGDVRSYTVDTESDGEPEFLLAPDEASVDVLQTAVAHGDRRLSLTLRVRDVQTANAYLGFVRVFTPGARYSIEVMKAPGRRTDASLSVGNVPGGVTCRGLRAKVDGSEDTITVSVPTSCIGAPRWVQVGAGLIGFSLPAGGAQDVAEVIYADDAHRPTISDNSIARGPRVHRG